MEEQELRDMFKVSSKEAKELAPNDGQFQEGNVDGLEIEDISPTALDVDLWDINRAERLIEESPEIKKTGLPKEAVADFFNSSFEPEPKLMEKCLDPQRHDFVKTLLETPAYRSLHEGTALNLMASEMASVQFTTEYYKLVQQMEEKKKQQAGKKGGKPDPEKDKQDWEMACIRAAGKSVEKAQQDVDDFNDAMDSCGLGGSGADPKTYNVARMKELFKQIRSNPQLRRISELAGKYRRFAQGRQRQKTHHGYGDMIGLRLDDQLDRVIEEELIGLVDPVFELDAARRLVEKEMYARDYSMKKKVGKGPIVVVVDESGSMGGDKICQAKAIALALAWIAKHQKRWIALVGFSGGTEGTHVCFPPDKWNEPKLLEWLLHNFGGGTDADLPLVHLPNVYWKEFQKQGLKEGVTDIIMISDAIMSVDHKIQKDFNNWKKKNQAKVIGIMIGVNDAGGLKGVLDECYYASNLSTDHEGVQAALSI